MPALCRLGSMAGAHFTPARRRIAALRLAAQRLMATEHATAKDAVRWMLGMQAQDWQGAKWSVGLRTRDGTEAGVEAACDAGEIVRSWPLRGTLHLVAAEDVGWLLELTGPRTLASATTRRAALEITDADIARAHEAAAGALTGRRTMTRAALLAAFDAAGVSTAGQRGYNLLWDLALTGTLVLGPSDGRQQTLALLEDWVPNPRRLEHDEALGELAVRYFRSHGPATEKDLVRWAGLTLRDVRTGIAVAEARLAHLDLDGATYRLAPETLETAGALAAHPRVHLLPGFDEYVLGYGDRSTMLAPEHAATIVPGGNGMFKPTLVVDGEVAGTWRRTLRARHVVVEPTAFGELTPEVVEEMRAAAQQYGDFMGRTVELRA